MSRKLRDGATVSAAVVGQEEIVSCFPSGFSLGDDEIPKEKFAIAGFVFDKVSTPGGLVPESYLSIAKTPPKLYRDTWVRTTQARSWHGSDGTVLSYSSSAVFRCLGANLKSVVFPVPPGGSPTGGELLPYGPVLGAGLHEGWICAVIGRTLTTDDLYAAKFDKEEIVKAHKSGIALTEVEIEWRKIATMSLLEEYGEKNIYEFHPRGVEFSVVRVTGLSWYEGDPVPQVYIETRQLTINETTGDLVVGAAVESGHRGADTQAAVLTTRVEFNPDAPPHSDHISRWYNAGPSSVVTTPPWGEDPAEYNLVTTTSYPERTWNEAVAEAYLLYMGSFAGGSWTFSGFSFDPPKYTGSKDRSTPDSGGFVYDSPNDWFWKPGDSVYGTTKLPGVSPDIQFNIDMVGTWLGTGGGIRYERSMLITGRRVETQFTERRHYAYEFTGQGETLLGVAYTPAGRLVEVTERAEGTLRATDTLLRPMLAVLRPRREQIGIYDNLSTVSTGDGVKTFEITGGVKRAIYVDGDICFTKVEVLGDSKFVIPNYGSAPTTVVSEKENTAIKSKTRYTFDPRYRWVMPTVRQAHGFNSPVTGADPIEVKFSGQESTFMLGKWYTESTYDTSIEISEAGTVLAQAAGPSGRRDSIEDIFSIPSESQRAVFNSFVGHVERLISRVAGLGALSLTTQYQIQTRQTAMNVQMGRNFLGGDTTTPPFTIDSCALRPSVKEGERVSFVFSAYIGEYAMGGAYTINSRFNGGRINGRAWSAVDEFGPYVPQILGAV